MWRIVDVFGFTWFVADSEEEAARKLKELREQPEVKTWEIELEIQKG